MKTHRFLCHFSVTFAWALLPLITFAEGSSVAAPVLPPSNVRVAIAVSSGGTRPPVAAPVQWADIRDCPSEMRERFFAGFQQLEALVNRQIEELAARSTVDHAPGAAPAELDLALSEMRTARFFLLITADALRRATTQTWDQQKAKVGLAWTKSQEVYQQLKART